MNRFKKRKDLINREVLDKSIVVEALFNALTKNPAFFERKVRRWFSRNFNTALMDTFKIPWDQILTHYYESMLEDRKYNDIYDMTVEDWLPDIKKKKEIEDDQWIMELEREQQELLKRKEMKAVKKTPVKKKVDKEEEGPVKELMNIKFEEEDLGEE